MKNLLLLLLVVLTTSLPAQQEVIRLYAGVAPGSESWDWEEEESDKNVFNTNMVYNVVDPTLTVFPAHPNSIPTGTSVIIAPGGGFHFLSIENEGYKVAERLSNMGVTAFVLKYRLVQVKEKNPGAAMMAALSSGKYGDIVTPIVPLAMEDGLRAVEYVREHADQYNLNPDRIGVMGFSAGGTVALSVAYNGKGAAQPNFFIPVYAHADAAVAAAVPSEAMPAFIVVAADDPLGLVPNSIDLYEKWRAGNQSAELHIYETGGHGFGTRRQNMPTDNWMDRLEDWLGAKGLLWPDQPQGWYAKRSYSSMSNYTDLRNERKKQDWGNFKRYAMANEQLAPLSAGEQRIVFMGNSITEGWSRADSSFFTGKPYVNRGISGQTTPQMLVRFRADVIDLNPAAVVILAGINDIAENTGPITLEAIYGNIVSMVELARANDIEVVLCSVLPARDFPWRPGMEPAKKVVKLNQMLQDYAKANDLTYVDYFSAMVDEHKGLPDNYAYDGVHPTLEGYRVMAPLVEAGIKEALGK